jgi:rhodanese-related sulfurtransferase
MKHIIVMVVAVILSMFVVGVSAVAVTAADVPRITKEELKSMLGNPDVIVLDVRKDSDWKASDQKILGAVRENPNDSESWAGKYPKTKTPILYCA